MLEHDSIIQTLVRMAIDATSSVQIPNALKTTHESLPSALSLREDGLISLISKNQFFSAVTQHLNDP